MTKSRYDKYTATVADVVMDIFNEVLRIKQGKSPEIVAALEEVEDILIWWENTPAYHGLKK